MKNISKSGKDLITRLICKDPSNRISAKNALKHKWFEENLKKL